MRYEILGDTLPVAVCHLSSGERMVTEGGSMSWMSPNMEMETTGGGFGKAMGRMFSGEKIFQNIYTCRGGDGLIAFASSFPGSIRAFNIGSGSDLVLQKSAFLACEAGVELSVHFNRKLGAGFFGGEGFIMQRLSGAGVAFAEFDGHVVEYDLGPGQRIIVDTGHLAAMTASCSMEVEKVHGAKNIFFGGEGLFHTVVTGPGHVWLQTMPISNFAGSIAGYLPTSNS